MSGPQSRGSRQRLVQALPDYLFVQHESVDSAAVGDHDDCEYPTPEVIRQFGVVPG
jgi:hypothetical protein